jgi:heterodisulfide reductase subunit A2
MTVDDKNNAVLIVGAGIAGMGAAMHLAAAGHPVYLLDAAPAIGGSMHLFDHTFPTNSCGICLMLPHQPAFCPTFECDRSRGSACCPTPNWWALKASRARFRRRCVTSPALSPSDPDRCTGCGDCAAVCPEARPHDHEGWVHPVKAIYRPPGCGLCPIHGSSTWRPAPAAEPASRPAPRGPSTWTCKPREETLAVGALLLTPGFAPFDARVKGEYGYGVYPNVLSALEFERMVSLAGSEVARLACPSDGRAPKRVAFVHCVGSRDALCGAGHCSSACCMYTAKQVALAKKLDPDLEVTVFFMDLRAFGKDFEAYIDACRPCPASSTAAPCPRASTNGSRAARCSSPTPARMAGSRRNLSTSWSWPWALLPQPVCRPWPATWACPQRLWLPLQRWLPPQPHRAEGLFVAGAFREPKDIPETVAEAAGRRSEGGCLPAGRRQRGEGPEDEAPTAQRNVSEEEPRLGVFVCECNGDLQPLDVPGLVDWAQQLPGVTLAQAVPLGCSAEGRQAMGTAIAQAGLNRVVMAGCSPRLFTADLEALMREAGLDSRLLARVNLREQVVYPHRATALTWQPRLAPWWPWPPPACGPWPGSRPWPRLPATI